jgi:murein L,D-transpeptidase YafK
MKQILFLLIFISSVLMMNGQTSVPAFNFIEYQRTFPRISDAMKRKEDTLKRQFRQKNLEWPVKNIYLRSFKYDSQLEVWVKYDKQEKYKLFKTYKVCALAGTLGPKRMQGDYQVPEGFYYINEFNPRSNYYLSLGLNYPNSADRMLGDSLQPGGDIFIHGKCVTTGCIPIMDNQIEELYILAAMARSQGQDFIPVHIFPVDFKNQKSTAYLSKYLKQFPEYIHLAGQLKQAFLYFDRTKKLPLIMTGSRGEYIVGNTVPEPDPEPLEPAKKERRPIKSFDEESIPKLVDKLPVYPGGNLAFKNFINEVSSEMSAYLDPNQSRTYVMIEFIIDSDGHTAYSKVIKGGNDEMNDRLQEKFENMPAWAPATRLEKNVAIKLKQSLEIVRQ